MKRDTTLALLLACTCQVSVFAESKQKADRTQLEPGVPAIRKERLWNVLMGRPRNSIGDFWRSLSRSPMPVGASGRFGLPPTSMDSFVFEADTRAERIPGVDEIPPYFDLSKHRFETGKHSSKLEGGLMPDLWGGDEWVFGSGFRTSDPYGKYRISAGRQRRKSSGVVLSNWQTPHEEFAWALKLERIGALNYAKTHYQRALQSQPGSPLQDQLVEALKRLDKVSDLDLQNTDFSGRGSSMPGSASQEGHSQETPPEQIPFKETP